MMLMFLNETKYTKKTCFYVAKGFESIHLVYFRKQNEDLYFLNAVIIPINKGPYNL